MVSPTCAWAGPSLTIAIFGWIGSRWWWSVVQTCSDSGSVPHTVAVLSMPAVDGVGMVKSFVRVVEAPTARLPTVPTEPSLSSLTATFVSGTSPMLVTLNVYVTLSPSWAWAGPLFSTLMAGWIG